MPGRSHSAGLLLCVLLALTSSCSVASLFSGTSTISYHEDRLMCASIAEGSPFFVYLDIPRGRNEDAVVFKKTRWEYEAWMFHKNTWKCFFVRETREGKEPKKIMSPDKKVLVSWTEKDQLVFGLSGDSQDVLVLTNPIYADRGRKLGDADVTYTLVPVNVYMGRKLIAGSAFYQHVALEGRIDRPQSPSRIESLREGTRIYLWDRTGGFWYIEQLCAGNERRSYAATQNRRGGWEEAYEVEIPSSDSLLFGSGTTADDETPWTVVVPGWRMEAQGTLMRRDASASPASSSAGNTEQGDSMGALVNGLPEHPSLSRTRLYGIEGTIRIENEKRQVYGILQLCCPKSS